MCLYSSVYHKLDYSWSGAFDCQNCGRGSQAHGNLNPNNIIAFTEQDEPLLKIGDHFLTTYLLVEVIGLLGKV